LESPEAALESDEEAEERSASQQKGTAPPASAKPVNQNKASEVEEEKDHIFDAIVDENKATEDRNGSERMTSPESALETDEEDEEKAASQQENKGKEGNSSEEPKNPFFDASSPQQEPEDNDKQEDQEAPAKPKDAQSELDDAVAEDSEDETTHERHGIEK